MASLQKSMEDMQDSSFLESRTDRISFPVKREVKKLLDEGKQRLEAGQIDDAIKFYTHAVNADENCPLSYFNLGYAYHEKGQLEFAKRQYEKAIELEPSCSFFVEHLARLHFESLEYATAAKMFHRASIAGPIQPVSLGLWGRSLFEQGLYEQSIEAFERLLLSETQAALINGTRFWMILASIRLGKIAAARKISSYLLSDKTIDHKILFELGEQFIRIRCLSLAKRIFERISREKEEILIVKLRLEDIEALEKKIDDIIPKLYDGDEEEVLRQIHQLREFGNDKISKAFLSLIHSSSAPIREAVVLYQTTYGYDVSETVITLIDDPVHYVRDAVFDFFIKMDSPQHIPIIAGGLNDELPTIRLKAAKFMGRFGTIEDLPKLEMALENTTFSACVDEIRNAISSIKHRYQKHVDTLSMIDIVTEEEDTTFFCDWKRWILITFQIASLSYLFYYLSKYL